MLFQHQREDPTILLFHQLNRAHRRTIMEEMYQNDLQDVGNPMLLFILSQVMDADETSMVPSQKALAEMMQVSPATIANSLKSLERGGYVRKAPDPKDARCNQVFITEKGRLAVSACMKIFDAVDAQLLSGFSPAELNQLRSYHQRMLNNLHQPDGDGNPTACCGWHPHGPSCHGPISNRKE